MGGLGGPNSRELFDEFDVVAVAAALRGDAGLEPSAEEVKVAKQIEHLVAGEFLREAEALFLAVEPVHADDDGVLQGPALGQPRALERLDLVVETEGPRRGDLACEG